VPQSWTGLREYIYSRLYSQRKVERKRGEEMGRGGKREEEIERERQ
jgi:hypothetical protein